MSDTTYSDNLTLLIKKIEAAERIISYEFDANTATNCSIDTYKSACEFLAYHFKKLDASQGYR